MNEMVAGVDEAGVSPLAGPVVAAAVILNPQKRIYKLRDSKILSSSQRDILYEKITERALAYAVGIASVEEIDSLNIFHATMLAMERAILNLPTQQLKLVLIDGKRSPKITLPTKTIVRGDQLIKSISAASIIAKVTRDRLMLDYHQQYPHYNFDKHKGYPTKLHQQCLQEHGVCPLHRRSFAMVKRHLK